jgi:hypothetical protein
MLSPLGTSLDRWIANAILTRARRRWVPLRLVPARWIRPLVTPTATLIRRELTRTALTTAALAGAAAALLVLVSV